MTRDGESNSKQTLNFGFKHTPREREATTVRHVKQMRANRRPHRPYDWIVMREI
jgi:hypothetical protein